MANPDRYSYDPDQFFYDEDYNTLTDRDTGERFTGDGERIDDDDD